MFERIRWYILAVLTIIIFGFIFYEVAFSPKFSNIRTKTGFQKEGTVVSDSSIFEPKVLGPQSRVFVTLENGKIHRKGCPEIKGTTEKMSYSTAIDKRYMICPKCIKEE